MWFPHLFSHEMFSLCVLVGQVDEGEILAIHIGARHLNLWKKSTRFFPVTVLGVLSDLFRA